eukprot:CAMPEP_0169333912 /NCGR_PEP_ID=MMETSP1017-20121227/15510_1 /TAXON_ID=342587 /ORGANISM="Karlodinium micrum, Strain CCMP2283" /LENGTH=71 /DNA_ID=CAMNT_0009429161 /DNA_START=159 /DNA_END=371 /DNA_ORIENTATION=-
MDCTTLTLRSIVVYQWSAPSMVALVGHMIDRNRRALLHPTAKALTNSATVGGNRWGASRITILIIAKTTTV